MVFVFCSLLVVLCRANAPALEGWRSGTGSVTQIWSCLIISILRTLLLDSHRKVSTIVCVCVCACVRVHVCVRVCVCVCVHALVYESN